jgi:hypothetical protein
MAKSATSANNKAAREKRPLVKNMNEALLI